MEIEEQKLVPQQQNEQQKTFVFAWGLGAEGQVGNNKTINEKTPFLIKNLPQNVSKISCGNLYSAAVTTQGDLYVWGSNKKGQLGINESINILIPKLVKTVNKVQNIACGDWHSVILTQEGIWTTGYNKYGCLGTGDQTDRVQYTKLSIDQQFSQIAAGRNVTLLINQNNQIYSCGVHGLNGISGNDDILVPTKIKNLENEQIQNISAGYSFCACVTNNGSLYTWGQGYNLGHVNITNYNTPKKVEALEGKNIVQCDCTKSDKYTHMGCISDQGELFTWGSGYKGKLGHENDWTHKQCADQKLPKKVEDLKENPIRKFIAGGIHSAVLNRNNQLLTFGCGSDGRLGHKEIGNAVYLYKEGFPKVVEGLSKYYVLDSCSSKYHMVAVCQKI